MIAPDECPVPLDDRPKACPEKKRLMRYDPTINLGHVLTFLGFLAVGTSTWYGMRAEIAEVRTHLTFVGRSTEKLATDVDKLTTLTIASAQQSERIHELMRRLDNAERRLGNRSEVYKP